MSKHHVGTAWPAKARFESKYQVLENGCWQWTASKFPSGYGQFKYPYGGKMQQYAHRVSAHIHLRFDFNPSVVVCHNCDNTSCVNPAHLTLADTSYNQKDSVSKGRHVAWNRKFGLDSMELAIHLRSEGAKLSQIQEVLGCDLSTASLLSRGLRVEKSNGKKSYVKVM